MTFCLGNTRHKLRWSLNIMRLGYYKISYLEMLKSWEVRMIAKIAKYRIGAAISQQRELMFDKYPNLLNRDTQLNTKVTKTIETQIILCS